MDRGGQRQNRQHRAEKHIREWILREHGSKLRDDLPDDEIFYELEERTAIVEGWQQHCVTTFTCPCVWNECFGVRSPPASFLVKQLSRSARLCEAAVLLGTDPY